VKRVTLVLAGLLCAAALTAQSRPPRTQTGNATQEMQTAGLSAAHNSLPLGSKAKIRNLSNGREIEVTITEQIPTSTRRIIDLSPSAALALELGFGGPVIVTPLGSLPSSPSPEPVEFAPQPVAPAPQPVAPAPQPVAPPPQIPTIAAIEPEPMPEYIPEPIWEPEPEPPAVAFVPEPLPPPPPAPEPIPEPARSSTPYTVINNYYIMSPEDWQRLQKSGALPLDSGGAMPYGEPSAEPYTGPGDPPVSYSTYTAPPVSNIRIIPAVPSPHSGKTYRLLVGTYPSVDSAFHVYRQLKAAGFEAVQEQAGNMCRVFAVGVPAPSVYYAAQRLGAIGFEQVWVYER